jgi:ubiquinol-cytochrome c reductase cytochrome b subunit
MLGGAGGQRGPALDDVATRLTHDELVRQVLQGGGNMPAYGKNLSPAQVSALVSFLGTLYPQGHRPAQDGSGPSSSTASAPSPSPANGEQTNPVQAAVN